MSERIEGIKAGMLSRIEELVEDDAKLNSGSFRSEVLFRYVQAFRFFCMATDNSDYGSSEAQAKTAQAIDRTERAIDPRNALTELEKIKCWTIEPDFAEGFGAEAAHVLGKYYLLSPADRPKKILIEKCAKSAILAELLSARGLPIVFT